MFRIVSLGLLIVATLSASATSPSAQQEIRPGYGSIAQTQITNRSAAEAVPVRIFNGSEPVPTTVVGVPTVALTTGSTVESRSARQRWEYQRIALVTGADPTAALNAAGADGWDAVGIVSMEPGRSAVLMKRPR
jgi:hypothetical protein